MKSLDIGLFLFLMIVFCYEFLLPLSVALLCVYTGTLNLLLRRYFYNVVWAVVCFVGATIVILYTEGATPTCAKSEHHNCLGYYIFS